MLNMRTMKQFAALLKPSSTGAGTDTHVPLDPSDISVAPAEPADMPAMVAVLYAALQADVFHHAVFSEETGRKHLQYRRELCQISLEHDINQPGTHLLVAKNTKTGEVLGFSGFREDAGQDDGPRTTGFLPYGELTNIRIRTFLDRLHDIHRKHLTDPHLGTYLPRTLGVLRFCADVLLLQLTILLSSTSVLLPVCVIAISGPGRGHAPTAICLGSAQARPEVHLSAHPGGDSRDLLASRLARGRHVRRRFGRMGRKAQGLWDVPHIHLGEGLEWIGYDSGKILVHLKYSLVLAIIILATSHIVTSSLSCLNVFFLAANDSACCIMSRFMNQST